MEKKIKVLQSKGNTYVGHFPAHWVLACCFCFEENRNGWTHGDTHILASLCSEKNVLFAGFIIKQIFVEKY